MSFIPDIRLFTCHYASQQGCASQGKELQRLGLPKNIHVHRVACTGKLNELTLLKSFEDGADGVYVVGCPIVGCHNAKGSERAARRVSAVRNALRELDVEPDRIMMYHLPRGLNPEFIDAGKKMDERIGEMGPSPFS